MELKPGVKSSEFWKSLIVALGAPIVGLLVANGVLDSENAQLITQIIGVLAVPVGIYVAYKLADNYEADRTELKKLVLQNGKNGD